MQDLTDMNLHAKQLLLAGDAVQLRNYPPVMEDVVFAGGLDDREAYRAGGDEDGAGGIEDNPVDIAEVMRPNAAAQANDMPPGEAAADGPRQRLPANWNRRRLTPEPLPDVPGVRFIVPSDQ